MREKIWLVFLRLKDRHGGVVLDPSRPLMINRETGRVKAVIHPQKESIVAWGYAPSGFLEELGGILGLGAVSSLTTLANLYPFPLPEEVYFSVSGFLVEGGKRGFSAVFRWGELSLSVADSGSNRAINLRGLASMRRGGSSVVEKKGGHPLTSLVLSLMDSSPRGWSIIHYSVFWSCGLLLIEAWGKKARKKSRIECEGAFLTVDSHPSILRGFLRASRGIVAFEGDAGKRLRRIGGIAVGGRIKTRVYGVEPVCPAL